MHTDEYEISLTREINVCRSVIKQTQIQLTRRRQRFGMDLPQAVATAAEGSPVIDGKELVAWQEDVEALSQWEQRLEQYHEALAAMRISASQF
jgi:hypothetical protein